MRVCASRNEGFAAAQRQDGGLYQREEFSGGRPRSWFQNLFRLLLYPFHENLDICRPQQQVLAGSVLVLPVSCCLVASVSRRLSPWSAVHCPHSISWVLSDKSEAIAASLPESAQEKCCEKSLFELIESGSSHYAMRIAPLASYWLLMLVQGASGWVTTRTITAANLSNPSSKMLAFFAPTPTRFANVDQQREQHRRPAELLRQPSPPAARGRAARRAAPRARTVLTCRSDGAVDEEPRGERDSVSRGTSMKTTNINVVAGSLMAAWSAFPTGAWAAAAAIVGDAGGMEMGARLDAPAAISFGAVVAAFAFLQVRTIVSICRKLLQM